MNAYKHRGYSWNDVIDMQFAARYPNRARTGSHTHSMTQASKFRIAACLPYRGDFDTIDDMCPQDYFKQQARRYLDKARRNREART